MTLWVVSAWMLVSSLALLLGTTPVMVAALGGEKAAFLTEPFSEGVSHRQDFCQRWRKVLNNSDTMTLRDALSGVQLNVVLQYGDAFPYFNYDHETGIDPDDPGLVAELLDYIAERANFTWRQSFDVYTGDEKGENKTWTEMLTWAVDTYDISIDKWAQSTERLDIGIAFCDPWFDASYIMVDKLEPVGRNTINLVNWAKPFEWQVWLVVIGTIFFSCFVYQILEWMSQEREDRSFRKWFMDNLYLSFINFTQNYMYEPTSLSARIFGISFAFWTMLIGATYTANLASLLVEAQKGPLIVDTLDQAVALQMPVCTFATSASDIYFQRHYPKAKRIPKDSPEAMYAALNNNECDISLGAVQSWESFQLIEEYNPDCNLERVGRTVQPVDAAFTTKIDPGVLCTSLINEVFNIYLSEMTESSWLQNKWNDFNLKQATEGFNCNAEGEDDSRRRQLLAPFDYSKNEKVVGGFTPWTDHDHRDLRGGGGGGGGTAAAAAAGAGGFNPEEMGLTLEQMAGTFFMHAVGCVLALIVGAASMYEKSWNRKRHGSKGNSTAKLEDGVEAVAVSRLANGSYYENGNGGGSSPTSSETASLQAQLFVLQANQRELSDQMKLVVSMLNNIHAKLDDDDDGAGSFKSAKSEPVKQSALASVRESLFGGGRK